MHVWIQRKFNLKWQRYVAKENLNNNNNNDNNSNNKLYLKEVQQTSLA